MILRRKLPREWAEWNDKWNAPYGRLGHLPLPSLKVLDRFQMQYSGMFHVQPNNDIRVVEYPWAFHASELRSGMKVLEIGGGLSGFQFVLDRHGVNVTNVDPGINAMGKGWKCDQESILRLNKVFRTSVQLFSGCLPELKVEEGSVDRVISISVLEHLDPSELRDTMASAYRALKPGGKFVITTDLFIDTAPFSSRKFNKYGSNVDIVDLCNAAPFEMILGEKSELFGFDEFDADIIQGRLSEFFIGKWYPALAQAFVLRKPE